MSKSLPECLAGQTVGTFQVPHRGAGAVALVADDHELFRSGFSLMLKRELGFDRVLGVGGLDDAVQALGQSPLITFATFDLGMPGMQAAEGVHSVRAIFPQLCVAIVTGSNRREDMLRSLAAGAHGYILKTWTTAEICAAIKLILSGIVFFPRAIIDIADRRGVIAAMSAFDLEEGDGRLTPRQRDVLALIRGGHSNKEIARRLGLTESTVKVHASALYRAIGVHNRAGVAAWHRGPT